MGSMGLTFVEIQKDKSESFDTNAVQKCPEHKKVFRSRWRKCSILGKSSLTHPSSPERALTAPGTPHLEACKNMGPAHGTTHRHGSVCGSKRGVDEANEVKAELARCKLILAN